MFDKYVKKEKNMYVCIGSPNASRVIAKVLGVHTYRYTLKHISVFPTDMGQEVLCKAFMGFRGLHEVLRAL